MKKAWLAALLNAIPGVGYIYLNVRRPLGWLLLGAVIALVISTFDPSLGTGDSPSGIWALWTALFFLLPYAAFIIDAYLEAKRMNAAKPRPAEPAIPATPRGTNISVPKFIFLSAITAGVYQVYWLWRMWETVRNAKEETYRFRSSLRALFGTLSVFWLFPQLYKLAEGKGYRAKVPAELLATLYFIAAILGGFTRFSWIFLPISLIATTVIVLPVVKIQQYYMKTTKAKFAPPKTNWWLILFLVGIILVSFIIGFVAAYRDLQSTPSDAPPSIQSI